MSEKSYLRYKVSFFTQFKSRDLWLYPFLSSLSRNTFLFEWMNVICLPLVLPCSTQCWNCSEWTVNVRRIGVYFYSVFGIIIRRALRKKISHAGIKIDGVQFLKETIYKWFFVGRYTVIWLIRAQSYKTYRRLFFKVFKDWGPEEKWSYYCITYLFFI